MWVRPPKVLSIAPSKVRSGLGYNATFIPIQSFKKCYNSTMGRLGDFIEEAKKDSREMSHLEAFCIVMIIGSTIALPIFCLLIEWSQLRINRLRIF